VLGRFASPTTGFLAGAAAVAVVGVLLGAVHRDFADPGASGRAAKALGVALVSVGGFMLVVGATKPSRTLSWEHADITVAREKALREQRPLLVDFTAAWCGACKELDKLTFSEPRVASEAGRFIAVKVDATNSDDPKVEAAMQDFKVIGLPTVVVHDSSGKEALRCTDFVEADPFLEVIKKVN
jgi:thioredoxin:protein disulfide reductase